MSKSVLCESLHRPAAPRRVVPRSACALRSLGCAFVLAAAPLGGCSVSMPMGSMLPADDVTASLAQVPFGQLLDEEDRRREKAALATALDPQGDGSTIQWANPKTRHKGAITAVGHAFPVDNKVCRRFQGELTHDGGKRSLAGTACIVAAGEWAMKDLKTVKKA